jgi:DNA-binding MarR family transcriptional regulator
MRIADEELRLFNFNLPIQLSPFQIREMAAQAGIDLLGDDNSADIPKSTLALMRARWILKNFERRAVTSFGAHLGEPGWTILLDLYVREATGKKTNVSSAIVGSMAPATTGLRWIHFLTEKGVIFRSNDEHDARIAYVTLTDQTREEMTDLLGTMP